MLQSFSSSSYSHQTVIIELLARTVSTACWFPIIISGCMSIYVIGASRQGMNWFSPKHNPYLHAQLFAGAGATAVSLYLSKYSYNNKNNNHSSEILSGQQESLTDILLKPSKVVVLLAAASWSVYSALITKQRWRFREWRYIVSAHAPLAVLYGIYVTM